jgi:2-polyprenyl-6-methoxyphenol hydroxylase-like FAD-dependent oxidoreductase
MTMKGKVIIIGAGIGGLTTAIALRQAGFAVDVFERAPELKEIGAGIGLSANAIRVLKHFGLMEQVVDKGSVIETAVSYTSRGKRIGRFPMNLTDVPGVCLHRADLQQVLLSALSADCVHLGEEFVEYQQHGDHGVICRFASGRTAAADALIGADGLRSRVRAQLIGDGEPVYRGYQCWRGICDRPPNHEMTETFGAGVRVGVLPLGRRGTAWWCCANEPERETDQFTGGAKEKLLRWIGSWHPLVSEVIAATQPAAIIKTGIYDRAPVKAWSQGCCALLGDAAHPTTPNMGQGGGMAIEDAVVLARCLSNWSNPATAFPAYERLRFARTTRVTKLSRHTGTMGQWKNPGAVWFRNTLYRLAANQASTKAYLKFVNYDPYKISLNGGTFADKA